MGLPRLSSSRHADAAFFFGTPKHSIRRKKKSMPRPKRGNQRTRKEIRRGDEARAEQRELLFAEDGQTYGTVTAILGAGRFTVQ